MYHIVIEQTHEYKNRMEFDPIKNTFNESRFESLAPHTHMAGLKNQAHHQGLI